jgi:hypothetical protein
VQGQGAGRVGRAAGEKGAETEAGNGQGGERRGRLHGPCTLQPHPSNPAGGTAVTPTPSTPAWDPPCLSSWAQSCWLPGSPCPHSTRGSAAAPPRASRWPPP